MTTNEIAKTEAPRPRRPSAIARAWRRYVYAQFGNPHGPVGLLAGRIMLRKQSNVRRNLWTVDLLALRRGMHVLEIGHGPGFALQQVCARLGDDGSAVGFDRSAAMTGMARRRNRAAVAAGRLRLLTGTVEPDQMGRFGALDGPFDRIYAVNVVHFWTDPIAVLCNLAQRLAPSGRLLITLQPRSGDRSEDGVRAAGALLAERLRAAGLADVRVDLLQSVTPMAVCVSGGRSDNAG
ncbi:MAG: methyltransferase domain-containing protein [Alphaproteobacteria bacterium]